MSRQLNTWVPYLKPYVFISLGVLSLRGRDFTSGRMLRSISRRMLYDMAMLEQAARTCLAEYHPLRYMPTMATASDGVSLTAAAAPPSEERTETILNADSSAASAGNKADIKGGKKSKNRHLARMMRSNLASEAAAVRMFGVQSRLGGQRPDLKFFKVRAESGPSTMRACRVPLTGIPDDSTPEFSWHCKDEGLLRNTEQR